MRSQWEDITPARATEELKTARCGRNPSMDVIRRYARDMANGNWARTPEPVVYDGEDTGTPVLRDGQQRWYSVIEAAMILTEAGKIAHPDDFSITMWVTRGTTQEIEDAFPYLNTGKNRTGQDYLVMENRDNSTLLYTIGRRIALWNAGHVTGNSYKPTRAEILKVLEPQPNKNGIITDAEVARVILVEEATAFAKAWKVKPPVPAPAIAGFLWWLLSGVDAGARDTFLEYLRNGTGLTEAVPDGEVHPLTRLRNRLHADQYAARVRGATVKQETVLYLCLRSWGSWRRHEWPRKLQMPDKVTDKSFKAPR